MTARLDEYVRKVTAEKQFSGAVLVAQRGKTLLSQGYGFANFEWAMPNTRETRFSIASLTKPLTAVAVVRFAQQGQVAINASICKYLEGCPAAWQPITIDHLLSHTSGIPNYLTGNEPDIQVRLSQEQILSRLREQPLQFPPGTKFRYGNSGYFLLGLLIEKVTGLSYEEAMRSHIFEPLGMNDTGYDRPELLIERRASGYALVDGKLRNAAHTDVSWTNAAAGLYSTVEDLLKFDQALYGDRLLSKESRELMWRPRLANYGYGWFVLREGKEKRAVQRHGGGIAGFQTGMTRYPEDHATVIVLCNLPGAACSEVASGVADIMFVG